MVEGNKDDLYIGFTVALEVYIMMLIASGVSDNCMAENYLQGCEFDC